MIIIHLLTGFIILVVGMVVVALIAVGIVWWVLRQI